MYYGSTTPQQDAGHCSINNGDIHQQYSPTSNDKKSMTSFSFDKDFDSDDESSSAPAPSFPCVLLPLVPEVSPLTWIVINNTLALTGCVLIIEMLYAKGEQDERPFATAFSLIWEFGSCFFWTIETSLSACYQHYHLQTEDLAWYTKLEIVIAVYFMLTTLWGLLGWDVMGQDVDNEKIWELLFDTSFYVYLAVRSCGRASAIGSAHDEPTATIKDIDDCGDTAYQIMPANNGADARRFLV